MPIIQGTSNNFSEKYDEVVKKVLKKYEIAPEAKVELLNYSENIVYLVDERYENRQLILRLNKPGYHSEEEIKAELIWMKMIRKNERIPIPDSVPGKNGNLVQKIVVNHEIYYCVMFTFLTGKSLNDDIENLPQYFEHIGEISAQLHNYNLMSDNFMKLKRPTWDYDSTIGSDPKWGRWQDSFDITEKRKNLFRQVSEIIHYRLEKYGKSQNCFGLIHADLRTVNLLVDHQTMKVIDFDDCGYSWYLYDLAASLSFIEHMKFVPQLIELWIKGYRKYRYLSDDEIHEIPTFIMLRRLLLLAWIGSHSDTRTAQQLKLNFTDQTESLAMTYLKQYR